MQEKIRPFSNGFDFENWLYRNCYNNCICYTEKPTCNIEIELSMACFGDGKISKETYEKIINGCKNYKEKNNDNR